MSLLPTTDHGVLTDCYSQDWLKSFVELFRSQAVATNDRGFDEWNTLVGSHEHDFFSKLLEQIGFTREFGKPIIISLKMRGKHMGPHSDYPLTESFGTPYKSYLMPLNNFEASSTVIFNQHSNNIMGKHALEDIVKHLPVLPDTENACLLPMIDHVNNDVKKRLSVKNVLPWSRDAILHWDSNLLHCSCVYNENFGTSRDAVIIWTVKD